MNTANQPDLRELQSVLDLLHASGDQTAETWSGCLRARFMIGAPCADRGLFGFAGACGTRMATMPAWLCPRSAPGPDHRPAGSAVHVHNFRKLNAPGWLFSTDTSVPCQRTWRLTSLSARRVGFFPTCVVIEIQKGAQNRLQLGETVQFFRKQGYLIALDDFRAGPFNFDRVWNLRPASSSSTGR